jgi:hypothetical protein
METNDPRVRTEVVDGQVLSFPTPEAWEELEKYPVFGGRKIPKVNEVNVSRAYLNEWLGSQNRTSALISHSFP